MVLRWNGFALQARSHEAFEAICGLHGALSGCSQLESADGVRSCASAVMAGDAGEESAWGWNSPLTTSPRAGAPSGSRVVHGDSSSEIDTAAAGGSRSLRRGVRSLLSGMQRYGTANITVAFIFESGPVVLWIAASDARAKDSRGRRELLSSLLFFLSQFASPSQANGFSLIFKSAPGLHRAFMAEYETVGTNSRHLSRHFLNACVG